MFKFSIVQYSSLHIMLHIQFGGPQNSFDLMDKSNVDNVMQYQSVSKVLMCMWTHSSYKTCCGKPHSSRYPWEGPSQGHPTQFLQIKDCIIQQSLLPGVLLSQTIGWTIYHRNGSADSPCLTPAPLSQDTSKVFLKQCKVSLHLYQMSS